VARPFFKAPFDQNYSGVFSYALLKEKNTLHILSFEKKFDGNFD